MTTANVINNVSRITKTAKAIKFGMSFMPIWYHVSGIAQTIVMSLYLYMMWNYEGWVLPFVFWYALSTAHGWWIGANDAMSNKLWMTSAIPQLCVLCYLVYFIFG